MREHWCVFRLERPAPPPINDATRLESEGGADSWDWPRLNPIVEARAREKIGAKTFPVRIHARLRPTSPVFQLVDIDESYDNLHAGPQIPIFGDTSKTCPSRTFLSTHRFSSGRVRYSQTCTTIAHFSYSSNNVVQRGGPIRYKSCRGADFLPL